MAGNSNWIEGSPSPYEWERDALAFIQERWPEGDAYRVWTTFEFIDHDQSVHEVDLLAFSPRGAFLVEIKSWPDRTEGDAGTWFREKPNGYRRAIDNPFLLTNRKAKRLKSLLESQLPSGQRSSQLPFLQPLVFMSHPDIVLQLEGPGRSGICVRDADDGGPRAGYPGIVETLTTITAEDKQRKRFRPWSSKDAAKFAKALDSIGIREMRGHRRVGDWELGELLEEGSGWQEYEAVHVAMPDTTRRIRVFGAGSELDRTLVAAAAQREFRSLEPLDHPGILAPRDYVEADQGPALSYDREPTAVTLDHFLEASGSRLRIEQRLSLVRQLGEALGYAHSHGVFHRALSPRSVLVRDPEAEVLEIRVRDWHVSHRETASTHHTSTVTAHSDLLVEESADVYLAPEAGRSTNGEQLDVFALGAIAFHVFAGVPPAATLIERQEHLNEHGGLDLAAVVDGARDLQRTLINEATAPEVSKRTDSVKRFLSELDDVDAELARPETPEEGDPTTASKGQLLAGYEVLARLGRGGTAIAYLVSDDGEERVLKVAASAEHNSRIRAEGEVIASVSSPGIIGVHRDDVVVGGHAALLIDYAGRQTLADRLRTEGPPGLELLERWGDDLLQATVALEVQGVSHRDIKPENIGIRKKPPRDELRLTLYDFSLSRAPVDAIDAGTPPYLDPFLKDAGRRRWDLSAERFAAAVTLYEMSSGQLPVWGDNETDPIFVPDEVTIDDQLFDPSVAAELSEFFRRALARSSCSRFESAEEMLAAWRHAFEAATDHPTETVHPDQRDAALQPATPATLVGDLPLSARARSALRTKGVTTVADLVATSAFDLRSIPGVGSATRDEILAVFDQLVKLLPPEDAPDVQGLDLLGKQLVPSKGLTASERDALRNFLGLDGALWATAAGIASALNVPHAEVDAAVQRGRERWAKSLPSVTRLREEIADQLRSDGGFLPAKMLEDAIIVRRGAVAQGDERRRLASAALRSAVEAESRRGSPEFAVGRRRDLVVIGLTAEVNPADALTFLERLGAKASEIVTDEPLAAERAASSLRAVVGPSITAPSAERLARLAEQAAPDVAVNERGELYPKGMNPAVAVDRAAGVLTIGAQLTIEEIQSRLRARYPEAAKLPSRPELDDILKPLGLEWDASTSKFAPVDRFASTTRYTGGVTTDLGPTSSSDFAARLDRAKRRFLALTARTKLAARAERRLGTRDGVTHIALDQALIRHMKDIASESEAEWEAVRSLDVEPDDVQKWNILINLARQGAERLTNQLLSTPGTVLVSRAGLLRRYGQLDAVFEVKRQIESPTSDSPLKGLWMLVPADSDDALPIVDGEPIPVLDENEWAHVPSDWIRQLSP